MTSLSINIQRTRPWLWYRTFGVINCVYANSNDLNMAISYINQWGKSRYFCRSPSRMKTTAVVFISLPGVLVLPASKGQWEGAGLSRDLRWWDEDEGEGPRRRGKGEYDLPRKASPRKSLTTFRGAGPTGSVVTAQPWAFGRRLVGEEESGDTRRCLTRSRCLSAEDLSLERLLWLTPLSTRFDPALRWARNASRSSEGLSCRSASGPMFAAGTEGPTVGWGGASPTNCSQVDFISRMKSSFQLLIMCGEGPCGVFTASGCVTVGATEARPGADGGTGFPVGWTKGVVAPEKTPRKRSGGWGGRRVHFRVWKSRNSRWYRCRASWEGSWEASCRSWKSC